MTEADGVGCEAAAVLDVELDALVGGDPRVDLAPAARGEALIPLWPAWP